MSKDRATATVREIDNEIVDAMYAYGSVARICCMIVRASYTVNRATNKITSVRLEVLEEPPLLDGRVVQTARAAMIRERAMKAIVVGMHRPRN